MNRRCKYCFEEIEYHRHLPHEEKCYLNPDNLLKITEEMLTGFDSLKNLKFAFFYRWSRQNNILTPLTISKRLGLPWIESLYQLGIYSSLKGYVDFETIDVLLWRITEFNFFYSPAEINFLTEQQKSNVVSNDGWHQLWSQIINRAIRDLQIQNKTNFPRNKEQFYNETLDFLEEFAPESFELINTFQPEVQDMIEKRNE